MPQPMTVQSRRSMLGLLGAAPAADWIAIILSNYDTSIRSIVDLAREIITHP